MSGKPSFVLPDSAELSCAGAAIGILPKIESADSVGQLSAILDAADGAMVARGDLGAELPVQEVSLWPLSLQMLVGFIMFLLVMLCVLAVHSTIASACVGPIHLC